MKQAGIDLKLADLRVGYATTVARIHIERPDGTRAVAFVTVAINDKQQVKFGLTVLKRSATDVVRTAIASWLGIKKR